MSQNFKDKCQLKAEVVWDKDLVGKAGERGAVGEGGQWPRNGELRENEGAWEGAKCIGGKLRLEKQPT